jgi:hypothetical protein
MTMPGVSSGTSSNSERGRSRKIIEGPLASDKMHKKKMVHEMQIILQSILATFFVKE